MNLNPIGPNKTELELAGGLTVLFSYKTPVACRWVGCSVTQQTWYKTSKTWSNTTTRHINSWIGGIGQDDILEIKPQEYFDNLVVEIK